MFQIVFRDSSLYPGFFKDVLGTRFVSLDHISHETSSFETTFI